MGRSGAATFIAKGVALVELRGKLVLLSIPRHPPAAYAVHEMWLAPASNRVECVLAFHHPEALVHPCMPDYRRNRVAGGTYFFTVNLLDRDRPLLVEHIEFLRASVRRGPRGGRVELHFSTVAELGRIVDQLRAERVSWAD